MTISKVDPTIVVTPYSAAYDGNAHGVTGTATGVKSESLTGLNLGATFTNVPGGTANWTFTDVTGNYNNKNGSALVTISKAALTVTGIAADNKVYDQTTHATLTGPATLVGVLGTDNVKLNIGGVAGAFADKNVGASKTVTISGLTISGTDAGNYSLTQPTATADITARPLTVTGITANDKVYNGDAIAALNTGGAVLHGGIILGDEVTLNTSGAAGAFADKNVGTGKAVTVSGLTLDGTDAGNYAITPPTTTTAGITAKALTVSYAADNKVYDGNATAVVTESDDHVSGDLLTVSYTTALFNDKNTGTGKLVTVSGISVTGTDAGNYTFNTTATDTADITPKTATVTANNQTKIYGDANPAFDAAVTGTVDGDTLNYSLGTTAGQFSNVGDYTIAVTLGSNPNYSVTKTDGMLTIGKATLTVTAAGGKNKTYGDTFAAFTGTITGQKNGDTFTANYSSTGAGATANVGSYDITVGTVSGSKIGNYTVVKNDAANGLTVGQATLTVTATGGKNKTYGDTFTAFTGSISGAKNGDTFTVAYASTGAGATANVGSYDITVGTVSGTKISNYTVVKNDAANGLTVNKAALTVTANDANKTAGIELVFAGTEFHVSGLKNSDTVTSVTLFSTGAAASATTAGDYDIVPSAAVGTGLGNYTITYHTGNLTVNAAAADHLGVTGSATMIAGDTNELRIRAYDVYGNIATSFEGNKTLVFSGLSASPLGDAPDVQGVHFGGNVTVNFTNGESQTNRATLTAYKAENATVNVTSGGLSSTGHGLSLTVNPASADYFSVAGSATMTAGASNQLTITAYDPYGNLATGYAGNKTLTFSGLSNAPAGNHPQVEGVNFGSNTTVAFTAGVSNSGAATLVAFDVQSSTVNCSTGSGSNTISSTGHGLALTVTPAAADHLTVTGSGTMNAGASNELTITAYDQFGNKATSYTGIHTLTFSGLGTSGSGSVPTVEGVAFGAEVSVTFVSGQSTVNTTTLKAYKAESSTVDVTDGTINSFGSSSYDLNLTVNPLAANYFGITGGATPTAGANDELTVTAYDIYGNIDTNYDGNNKNLTFTSDLHSINGYVPKIEGSNFGVSIHVDFTHGVSDSGQATLVAYKAEIGTINVSSGSITSTGHGLTVTVSPAGANTLTITTQPANAGGSVDNPLTTQPVIKVTDLYGNNVADGVSVTASVTGGGTGSLRNVTMTTTGGLATYTALGYSKSGETFKIRFTANGHSVDSNTVSALSPGTADHLTVTGTGTMNAGASNELTITAYDQFGNKATSYTGIHTLTFSGLNPAAAGNVPTVEGVAFGAEVSVNFTSGVSDSGATTLVAYKAETATVSVTDGTLLSTGHGLAVTVNPLTASYFGITGGTTPTAGANDELTITAYDIYGNIDTSYDGNNKNLTFTTTLTSIGSYVPKIEGSNFGVSIHVDFTHGVSDSGQATLVAYRAEIGTIHVTSGSITSTGHDLTVTVNPGSAQNLTIVTQPANAGGSVDNPLTTQPVVRVTDLYGNNVADGVSVTASVTGGGTGSLRNVTMTTTGGLATYTALGYSKSGETFKIRFTANGHSVDSNTVSALSPGTADHLTVTGTGTMNAGASNELTITAYDQFGNKATSYTGIHTLTFSGLGTSGSGSVPTVEGVAFGAEVSVTFVSGQSTVNTTTLKAYKAESSTVNVTDGTLVSTGHGLSLTVNPLTASYFGITGGTTPTAGANDELTITAYDIYGNIDTSYDGNNKNLTFTTTLTSIGSYVPKIEGSNFGVSIHVDFTHGVSDPGQATLVAYRAETGTIHVTSGSITSTGHDLTVTVNPAAANTLTITTQPANAGGSVDNPLTTQPVIKVTDLYGNNVADGTTVTASVTGGGTGSLRNVTVTTTGGLATYTALGYSKSGEAFKIQFTTANGHSATSNTISALNTGELDHFTLTGIATSQTAGTFSSPVVTAYDAFNNVMTGYTGTIHFTSDNTKVTLPEDYTFLAEDNGTHTFTNGVRLMGASAGCAINVADGAVTASQTGIVVNPDVADHLTFSTQPSDTLFGGIISPAIVVEVRDQFENIVTSYDSHIDIAIGNNPSGGVLTGTVSRNPVNGAATFDDLSIDLVGAGYNLTASAMELPVATSAVFNMTATAPPTSTLTGGLTADILNQLAIFEVPWTPPVGAHDLAIYQFNSFVSFLNAVYFYQPLTSFDMAAFDTLFLDEGNLQFLNGTISLLGHEGLLPA